MPGTTRAAAADLAWIISCGGVVVGGLLACITLGLQDGIGTVERPGIGLAQLVS